MFNQIKLYVYGAIAAIGLFLVGMLKYLSSKNDKLEKELKTAKHNDLVKETVNKKEKQIQQGLDQIKQESEKVHEQNKQDAISRKRPSGSFLDDRL